MPRSTQFRRPRAKDTPSAHADEPATAGHEWLKVVREPWSAEIVSERQEGDGAIYIGRTEDLKDLDSDLLLQIHNAASGTALRRFPSSAVATTKTWSAIREVLRSQAARTRLRLASEAHTQAVNAADSNDSTPVDRAAVLRTEIAQLRSRLDQRLMELRSLRGARAARSESAAVRRAVELLRQPSGASKEALVRETGAKKGYIDALLHRILPAKGFAIRSSNSEGQRTKCYFIEASNVGSK